MSSRSLENIAEKAIREQHQAEEAEKGKQEEVEVSEVKHHDRQLTWSEVQHESMLGRFTDNNNIGTTANHATGTATGTGTAFTRVIAGSKQHLDAAGSALPHFRKPTTSSGIHGSSRRNQRGSIMNDPTGNGGGNNLVLERYFFDHQSLTVPSSTVRFRGSATPASTTSGRIPKPSLAPAGSYIYTFLKHCVLCAMCCVPTYLPTPNLSHNIVLLT